MTASTTTPARRRARFPGISSRAYEHPADRAALAGLRRLAGFDIVLRKLAGAFSERSLRLLYLANAVRVSDQQFPGLQAMVRDAAATLDLKEVPELYVLQRPIAQATTLGIDRPWIVVTTGLLDLLDEEELRGVVGHEVGHVLSGHAVYTTMLFHLVGLSRRLVWMPIGYWGLRAIIAALEEWFRKSELSCDRAGLLVGQDVGAALRAQLKVAGGSRLHEMNSDAFLAQAEEYDAGGDLRDGVLKILNLQGRTHPFAVLRAAELQRWVASGAYDRILAGDYPRREDDAGTSWRDEVKESAKSYREGFTESADPLFKLLKDLGEGAAGAAGSVFDRFTRRPPS